MPKAVLTLRLEPELVAEIDGLALVSGQTRSKVAAGLIREGLGRRRPMGSDVQEPEPQREDTATGRDEWIRKRAKQLTCRGMTTPVAVRMATREWEERKLSG